MDKKSSAYRILIVDDSRDIHAVFKQVLNYQPQQIKQSQIKNFPLFTVDSAYQGVEAVVKVEEAIKEGNPYALAFVDINMPPGWDGVKTIQQIWELDKDIQVVICTAGNDYSWEETVIQLGAIDNFLILKKPFDAVTVRQVACALTSKWKLGRQARQYTVKLENEVLDRTSQLQFQLTHDMLTNLPNRILLYDRIQQLIDETHNRSNFALFFLDLDRFKLINDSLGHSIGDLLLQAVALRLTEKMGSAENTIARIGGDEFVVLVAEIKNSVHAAEMAQELLDLIMLPYPIQHRELMISTSVGICLFPQDGPDPETLARNGDTAMYKAKERGPNSFQFYENSLNQNTLEKLELENELFQAVKKQEFILHYQPEFNLLSGEIEGIEALIRWQHPERGLVAPLEFIPLSEENGLILPISEWVLRKACRQLKAWQDKGMVNVRMAVNFAGAQFELREELVDLVRNILLENDLPPSSLEIELNENIIFRNQEIIETVHALKRLGVSIALDDFGAGYSNLSYLKKLPIDRLKIDKSYIEKLQQNTDDKAIIRAVIAVANSLDIEVVAEGVETVEQLDFLKLEGCHTAQGFYYTKALPSRELEEFVAKYPPEPK
jgi:diguanylate cyclase (GGDEF)-like protein